MQVTDLEGRVVSNKNVTDKTVALEDLVAQAIPVGTVSGRYEHGDKILFHPDIDKLRDYLENRHLLKLQAAHNGVIESAQRDVDFFLNQYDSRTAELGPDSPEGKKRSSERSEYIKSLAQYRDARIDQSQREIDMFTENKEEILKNLVDIVTTHLAIPHSDLKFPDPPAGQTGPAYTMAEPWGHKSGYFSAENFRKTLEDQRGWQAMVETLRHYGSIVTIIPTGPKDHGHHVWTRDPALLIHDGSSGPIAYISDAKHRVGKKANTFEEYNERLAAQGIPIITVPATIEGGNTLFDPHNNVILYGNNGFISPVPKNIEKNFPEMRAKIAEQGTPDELKEFDDWLKDFKKLATEEDVSAYNNLLQNMPDSFARIKFDKGDSEYSSLINFVDGGTISDVLKINSRDYRHFSMQNLEVDATLNRHANALQEATGVAVVPVTMAHIGLYHVDTFAAVIKDSRTGQSYLLINTEGTDAETMGRLKEIYGDNIIALNEVDKALLSTNLVQGTNNTLITNGFSNETTAKLTDLGFNVLTPSSLRFRYGFLYGIYDESSIRCLTTETDGNVMIRNPHIQDGPGTPFHVNRPLIP